MRVSGGKGPDWSKKLGSGLKAALGAAEELPQATKWRNFALRWNLILKMLPHHASDFLGR